MTTATGKTNNKDEATLGQVMCHINVFMCAFCALALCLFLQFNVTDEGENVDFTNNSNWFDIKLMTEPGKNNTKAVSNKNCTDATKVHIDELGIEAAHQMHFGRSVGPSVLQFDGLEETSLFKILGNWDMDVFQRACSA